MRFDLAAGFPCVTTKRLHLRSIIHELLWFLRGDTNIRYLKENGVSIWDEWADDRGDLGPVYMGRSGGLWRGAEGQTIDQIKAVIEQIRRNPDSRRFDRQRLDVADIERMKLPPCHLLFQFYVAEAGCRVSCINAARISSWAFLSILLRTHC